MTSPQDIEAFEAWWRKEYGNEAGAFDGTFDCYINANVHASWIAWQAASAAKEKELFEQLSLVDRPMQLAGIRALKEYQDLGAGIGITRTYLSMLRHALNRQTTKEVPNESI